MHLRTRKPPLSHGNTPRRVLLEHGAQSSLVLCNVLLNCLRRRDRKNGTSVTAPAAPTSGAGGSHNIPPPGGAGNLSVTDAGTAALMKEINTYLAVRYDPRMRVKLEEVWDYILFLPDTSKNYVKVRERAVLRDAAVAAACSSDLTASGTTAASTSAVPASRTWHAQSAVRDTSCLISAGPRVLFFYFFSLVSARTLRRSESQLKHLRPQRRRRKRLDAHRRNDSGDVSWPASAPRRAETGPIAVDPSMPPP